MAENKLPEFSSLEALTDFFDTNDMGDYWEGMPEVDFEISIAKKDAGSSLSRKRSQTALQKLLGIKRCRLRYLFRRGLKKSSSLTRKNAA